MFMNLTIYDTKWFTIRNICSPNHDTIHDSITMHHDSKYRAIHDTIHMKQYDFAFPRYESWE